jgi:SAM-dependent methyltransferase
MQTSYTPDYYEHLKLFESSKIWVWEINFALAKARKFLAYEKPKFLDIGCGVGAAKTFITHHFLSHTYLGIEQDTIPCQYLHRNSLDCLLADACNLPLNNESVDIALMLHTIAHFQQPERSVKEVYRVLRKGGLVIITTPNRAFVKLVIAPIEKLSGRSLQDRTVIKFFSKVELINILKNSGFKVAYLGCMKLSIPYIRRFIDFRCPLFGQDILAIGQKVA